MADLPTIDDAIDPQLSAYYERIDALTLAALNGNIDEQQFVEEMTRAVTAVLLLAYLLGGGTAADAETDPKYQERLEQNIGSVTVLADDIFSGRYSQNDDQSADEGKEKLENRLVLWVFSVAAVYELGKNKQPGTVIVDGEVLPYTETWRVGLAEHCDTCLALDGITLTPSEWDELGLEPRSPDLDCGGWNCKCNRSPEGRPSDGIGAALRALGV